MIKKSLLFGAIASVIAINSVFADTIVTSKQYVDNQDEAIYNELDEVKQDIIPAAGTNADRNGGGVSVVTYTLADGALGERGVCDADAEENGDCDDNNLVTRDLLSEQINNLTETTVTYKTCTEWLTGQSHTDENCILWNLGNKDVFGGCRSNSECNGSCTMCVDGACVRDPNCMK